MKKIISLLCALVLIVGCTKQAYYEIPLNADGSAYLTGVSSTTGTGISTLDGSFSVTAYLPNAKSGDVMDVELLQLQIPPSGGATKQLLPLTGTQKTATVGADLKATITYTAADAKMTAAGNSVTVIFNGLTDYAKLKVDMVPATVTTAPKVSGVVVEVARTAETAYFNVTILPKSGAYTGTLVVKSKNAKLDAFVEVPGSPFAMASPVLVPISGTDFAVGHDTMFYTFTATSGALVDMITTTAIVRDPYFYLKKTATLTRGGSAAARNLLINSGVAVTDTTGHLQISASGSLMLEGGAAWLAKDVVKHKIEFVATTLTVYALNNSTATIAAFDQGVLDGIVTTTANPTGAPAYIYKMVLGPAASDVYYGLMKMGAANATDGTVTIEYRIGNMYAHLAIIK
jgi:hypothetical protein